MSDKSAWMLSHAVADALKHCRNNDVKVNVNGVLVPVADVHYNSLADAMCIDLIDGEDLRIALADNPETAR